MDIVVVVVVVVVQNIEEKWEERRMNGQFPRSLEERFWTKNSSTED
jgi:hypothetical protein